MNTSLKLLTKILKHNIENKINMAEKQQGFKKNRSTVDATFIIRQIVEKSIEYNKPAYLCYVDLENAFDRVTRIDILKILHEQDIHPSIIELIKDINEKKTTRVITSEGTREPIMIKSGIREGDLLSPLLFSLIMQFLSLTTRTTYKDSFILSIF